MVLRDDFYESLIITFVSDRYLQPRLQPSPEDRRRVDYHTDRNVWFDPVTQTNVAPLPNTLEPLLPVDRTFLRGRRSSSTGNVQSISALLKQIPITQLKQSESDANSLVLCRVETGDPRIKPPLGPWSSKHIQTDCEICLGSYKANDKLRHLPCGHFFHKKCVDPWLSSNPSCPKCRSGISSAIKRLPSGPRANGDDTAHHTSRNSVTQLISQFEQSRATRNSRPPRSMRSISSVSQNGGVPTRSYLLRQEFNRIRAQNAANEGSSYRSRESEGRTVGTQMSLRRNGHSTVRNFQHSRSRNPLNSNERTPSRETVSLNRVGRDLNFLVNSARLRAVEAALKRRNHNDQHDTNQD
ncbi:E3 ubiquitin-protein ligase rnf6 [Cichlidogyrus casuarinus]|uniref:E3 ubiquitin-protein ligase rnf6 n=1 Tax=Cichlidogyrus casuarinus TaxID=1844966 RepID=A0ABD2QC83_9PLAT